LRALRAPRRHGSSAAPRDCALRACAVVAARSIAYARARSADLPRLRSPVPLFCAFAQQVRAVRRSGSLGALNPIPYPVIFTNCVLCVARRGDPRGAARSRRPAAAGGASTAACAATSTSFSATRRAWCWAFGSPSPRCH
jgi:hypothetical protein